MTALTPASKEPSTIPTGVFGHNYKSSISMRTLTLIISVASLVFCVAMIISAIRLDITQPYYVGAALFVSFVLNLLAWRYYGRPRVEILILLANLAFYGSTIAYGVIFAGNALQAAGILLVISLIAASLGMEGRQSGYAIMIGLVTAIMAVLGGTFSPLLQVSIPLFSYASDALLAGSVLFYSWLLFTGRLTVSLYIKIILAALTMVLATLIIHTMINASFLRTSIQDQTSTALKNAASQLVNTLDSFFKDNRVTIAAEASSNVFGDYLAITPAHRHNTVQEYLLNASLDAFRAGLDTKERSYLYSYALLNKLGSVVASTDKTEIGNSERNTTHFITPSGEDLVFHSQIEFSPYDNKPYLYFSTMVRNEKKEWVGILRAKYDAAILQSYAADAAGLLGRASNPMLLDDSYVRLADPLYPYLQFAPLVPLPIEKLAKLQEGKHIPSTPVDPALYEPQEDLVARLDQMQSQPFFTARVNQDQRSDLAVAVKMTMQPWIVVYYEDESVLTNSLAEQNRLTILIATILAGVISMITAILARRLNEPIQQLTATAQAISRGNLDAKAGIHSTDELGVLGNAFDLMTSQLQQSITGLEDRVNARTKELGQQNESLRFRARQFETIADVARRVASAQELEGLLDQVTNMISERFDFYHVGIFLVDQQGEYAHLRAANSEGGQKMLARQHKLKVGQIGIVGNVTENGQARIATDVGQDGVYFDNPDLPLTRSEMALPLKVGNQIIGALDVQSTAADAFAEEDIQLFTILSDQVAIAIYNNRLYTETSQALADAQLVHRRYLRQEWTEETGEGQHRGYRYTPQGGAPLAAAESPEINTVLETGAPLVTSPSAEDTDAIGESSLIVPVKLRGETIGVIRIQQNSGDASGMEEEVATVQAVADQVALALENARLFTQTSRRAERERRVLEITSKIRSTNDPEVMLQIAVEELQRALRASRAQVVLQPHENEPAGEKQTAGGNGNGNGHKPDQSHQ